MRKRNLWTIAILPQAAILPVYGVGAAVLTTDGTVKVTNSTITTDAADADGKSVTILDTNGKILANGESGYTITVDSLTE